MKEKHITIIYGKINVPFYFILHKGGKVTNVHSYSHKKHFDKMEFNNEQELKKYLRKNENIFNPNFKK